MRLLDFLFPPREDERRIRDMRADDFLSLLSPRVVSATTPETAALFPFSDARVRASIHEAKYHASDHAYLLLGGALAEYLRDVNEGVHRGVIVPIPLGGARRRERGYNQVEEVARCALATLGGEAPFEIRSVLTRTRETVSQVSLSTSERRENMRGAFRPAEELSPATTYIVLDDVITTGATLQAAINALRAGGATHILPLALAH